MNEKEKKSNKKLSIDLEKMAKAGLHLGHKTSKTHPKMKPYISGTKNNIHIINLEKSAEALGVAMDFVKKIVSEGKILLLVGTKVQIKKLLKETAEEIGVPYIYERWLGGTFTNFETLKKRLIYFKDLQKKKETGELLKYTKKERAKIDKELRGLEIKFGGIRNLEKLPDAIFVFDMIKDYLAIKEAKAKGIPVIAISHTNTDPTLADIVIPANDDARSSVAYILQMLKETIKEAEPKEENSKTKEKISKTKE